MLKTLETIVTLNWKQTRSGTMGAVNSIFSNGKKDLGNMQAEEFWVAVNYGIGSMLIAFVSSQSSHPPPPGDTHLF